nr:hypothetical protein [Acinetobacter guillouiae]
MFIHFTWVISFVCWLATECNADGTLTDHGKLNYTGGLELKDIQDHSAESNRGFNVSTSVGKSIKGESKESSLHPSGSTTLGLQSTGNEKEQLAKATMGQGSVTNTTTTSNRDINNTQEITRDQVTGLLNGSVTVYKNNIIMLSQNQITFNCYQERYMMQLDILVKQV